MPKEKQSSPEERMNHAARAAAVKHELEVIHEATKTRLIRKLVSIYRAGKGIDHDTMVGAVAEISGQMQMIDEIRREIAQSETENE